MAPSEELWAEGGPKGAASAMPGRACFAVPAGAIGSVPIAVGALQ